MNWHNELTDIFKTSYPLVQAPMLGITTPEMVAAAANCGMLGSLPVGGLSPQKTAEAIRKTKTLTDKPFAVNLFVYEIPEVPAVSEESAMRQWLQMLAAEQGLDYADKPVAGFVQYSYREQIPVLIEEGIRLVSFTFGTMDDDALATCRQHGMVLMGTATSVAEAVCLNGQDIDVIVAQGIEAGGHRGSFLDPQQLPAVGSFSLVPQIVDQVDCPVIAAGGIWDGRTARAAMMLGAKGIQVGSALLAAYESLAVPAYKAVLKQAADTDSRLTRAFSGRWARGLSNEFMERTDEAGLSIPEYPYQNSLTGAFRAAAQQQGNAGMFHMWAGQSAGRAEALSTAEILQRIVHEAAVL